MRATVAFFLLALVPRLLPDCAAAAEQGLNETQRRAVWDGGGCSPQEDSQDPPCEQLAGNPEAVLVTGTNSRNNYDTQRRVKATEADETSAKLENNGRTHNGPSSGDTVEEDNSESGALQTITWPWEISNTKHRPMEHNSSRQAGMDTENSTTKEADKITTSHKKTKSVTANTTKSTTYKKTTVTRNTTLRKTTIQVPTKSKQYSTGKIEINTSKPDNTVKESLTTKMGHSSATNTGPGISKTVNTTVLEDTVSTSSPGSTTPATKPTVGSPATTNVPPLATPDQTAPMADQSSTAASTMAASAGASASTAATTTTEASSPSSVTSGTVSNFSGASSAPGSTPGATAASPTPAGTASSPTAAVEGTPSGPVTSATSPGSSTSSAGSTVSVASPAPTRTTATAPAQSTGPLSTSTGAPTSGPGTSAPLSTTAPPRTAGTSAPGSTTPATGPTVGSPATASVPPTATPSQPASTAAAPSTAASTVPASAGAGASTSPAAATTPGASSPPSVTSGTLVGSEQAISSAPTTTVPSFLSTSASSTSTAVNCLNGGVWTGEACKCPVGFTGDWCEFLLNHCYNGGSWDGLKCHCPSLFYGPKCEEVVEGLEMALPQTVSAIMEVTVTVTNQVYNSKLEDQSSEEFKNFSTTFAEQMSLIYAGIPEYEGVNITRLRPGSVVVEHNIILKANYTQEYKQVLQQASQKVEEKIMNATKEQISYNNNTCQGFLLCFNSTATVVQNDTIVSYDPEEECQKAAGAYAAYFLVEYKDQRPYCITPCMSGFNASLDCHHGKCLMQPSGPRCNCLITDTHWYQGETCEWGVQKSLVYGLTGAGATVVLVALVVLLVFTLRARRVAKRQKFKVSQLYKWYEESGGPAPGTFQNSDFDLCEEDPQLDSIYSNFQPSLYNVDAKAKIHIQRPQVIMKAV